MQQRFGVVSCGPAVGRAVTGRRQHQLQQAQARLRALQIAAEPVQVFRRPARQAGRFRRH
jgi:hypothetical protein